MAEIKYLDLNGLKALYGVVDSKIQKETDRATAAEQALANKIDAMDLTDKAVDGEFVTAVHQTDGKISVVRGGVSSDKVTATAITGTGTTVAVAGENVAAQIASLGQTLKSIEGNAAKYKVVKLSDKGVSDLGDSANVREAYKVVSWTGDEASVIPEQVGNTIKIYKDAALLSVTPEDGVAGENTVIKFTYSLANGTQKEVSVDLGKAIFESEIGSGLQVNESGVVSVKLAEGNESFLTVGEEGVKLAGVQAAIDATVGAKNVTAEGDEYISATAANNKVTVRADVQGLTVAPSAEGSTITGTAHSLVDGAEVANKVAAFTNARIGEEIAKLDATVSADGGHVTVQVVEADGKLTAVSVNESDIASEAALTEEIGRAKDAEDKIEASVGLAANGSFTTPTGKHYINGATTVMDAVEKLDAQANTNAEKIAGMSVNEETRTVTIDNKSLVFTPYTAKEIQDAAGK